MYYKFIRRFVIAAALTCSAVMVFDGCDTVNSINLFSEDDEVQLGKQLDDEIRGNPAEYPIYTDNPSVKSYITSRIFKEIIASPAVAKKNIYSYSIEIIDQDSVLNAFTTSGGYIYVYTGLLKYVDSEAALAGVIAHEVGHAEKRHGTRRMTRTYGASLLLGIILGENPGKLAEISANLFAGLAFLANSRSDENESDEYAIEILKSTRYYAGSVKFFFEKMRDEGLVDQNSPKILTYLSTHPDPVSRIEETDVRLRSRGLPVKSYNSGGSDIFLNEYQSNVRSKIR